LSSLVNEDKKGRILKIKTKNIKVKKIPNYIYGKIPFDGPSRGRDGIEN